MAQYQFDPSQFGQAPAPPKPSPMKWLLRGGCLVVIACLGLCSVIYFIAQRQIEQTEEAYGEDIVNMCNPIRTETVTNVSLAEDYPYQVVVFGEGFVTKHSWHGDLPDAWQADDKDETDLVVCVREEEDIIEECPYSADGEDSSDPAILQRVQKRVDLYIFTPNGELVEKVSVDGEIPAECPDTRRISGTEKEEGDAVTYAQFEDVLRPIVEASAD